MGAAVAAALLSVGGDGEADDDALSVDEPDGVDSTVGGDRNGWRARVAAAKARKKATKAGRCANSEIVAINQSDDLPTEDPLLFTLSTIPAIRETSSYGLKYAPASARVKEQSSTSNPAERSERVQRARAALEARKSLAHELLNSTAVLMATGDDCTPSTQSAASAQVPFEEMYTLKEALTLCEDAIALHEWVLAYRLHCFLARLHVGHAVAGLFRLAVLLVRRDEPQLAHAEISLRLALRFVDEQAASPHTLVDHPPLRRTRSSLTWTPAAPAPTAPSRRAGLAWHPPAAAPASSLPPTPPRRASMLSSGPALGNYFLAPAASSPERMSLERSNTASFKRSARNALEPHSLGETGAPAAGPTTASLLTDEERCFATLLLCDVLLGLGSVHGLCEAESLLYTIRPLDFRRVRKVRAAMRRCIAAVRIQSLARGRFCRACIAKVRCEVSDARRTMEVRVGARTCSGGDWLASRNVESKPAGHLEAHDVENVGSDDRRNQLLFATYLQPSICSSPTTSRSRTNRGSFAKRVDQVAKRELDACRRARKAQASVGISAPRAAQENANVEPPPQSCPRSRGELQRAVSAAQLQPCCSPCGRELRRTGSLPQLLIPSAAAAHQATVHGARTECSGSSSPSLRTSNSREVIGPILDGVRAVVSTTGLASACGPFGADENSAPKAIMRARSSRALAKRSPHQPRNVPCNVQLSPGARLSREHRRPLEGVGDASRAEKRVILHLIAPCRLEARLDTPPSSPCVGAELPPSPQVRIETRRDRQRGKL